MAEIVMRIDGLEDTQRRLESYSHRVQERVDQTTEEYAFLIQRAAQIAAPVDTGFLRNNILAERRGLASWAIMSMADYSAFVEFGTRNTPAQPFLVPAALQYKQQYIKQVRRDIRWAW